MEILIAHNGQARCIYGEAIDLAALGPLRIQRGSHVEPDGQGCWMVDLSPVGGPTLGPYARRSLALAAEERWLLDNWLCSPAHN